MKAVWGALEASSSWRKVFKVWNATPLARDTRATAHLAPTLARSRSMPAAQSLSLLEHIIKNGNERAVEDARDHMHKIRSLTDYNFYEGTIDRGNGGESQSWSSSRQAPATHSSHARTTQPSVVREKSKNIIELLQDNERIREERDVRT